MLDNELARTLSSWAAKENVRRHYQSIVRCQGMCIRVGRTDTFFEIHLSKLRKCCVGACAKRRPDDPAYPRSILKSQTSTKNDRPLHSVHLEVQHKTQRQQQPLQFQQRFSQASQISASPPHATSSPPTSRWTLNRPYIVPFGRLPPLPPIAATPTSPHFPLLTPRSTFHVSSGPRFAPVRSSPFPPTPEPDPAAATAPAPAPCLAPAAVSVNDCEADAAAADEQADAGAAHSAFKSDSSVADKVRDGEHVAVISDEAAAALSTGLSLAAPATNDSIDGSAILSEIKSLRQRELLENEYRRLLEEENELQQRMLENLRLQEKQLHRKEAVSPSLFSKIAGQKYTQVGSRFSLADISKVLPVDVKPPANREEQSRESQTEPNRRRRSVKKKKVYCQSTTSSALKNKSSTHDLKSPNHKSSKQRSTTKLIKNRKRRSPVPPHQQSKCDHAKLAAKPKQASTRNHESSSSSSLTGRKRPLSRSGGSRSNLVKKGKSKRPFCHQASVSLSNMGLSKTVKKKERSCPKAMLADCRRDRKRLRHSAGQRQQDAPVAPENLRCSRKSRRPTVAVSRACKGAASMPMPMPMPILMERSITCSAFSRITRPRKSRPARKARRRSLGLQDEGFMERRGITITRHPRTRRAVQSDNTSMELKTFRREAEATERSLRRWSEDVRVDTSSRGFIPQEQHRRSLSRTDELTHRVSVASIYQTPNVLSEGVTPETLPTQEPEKSTVRTKGLFGIRKLILSRSKNKRNSEKNTSKEAKESPAEEQLRSRRPSDAVLPFTSSSSASIKSCNKVEAQSESTTTDTAPYLREGARKKYITQQKHTAADATVGRASNVTHADFQRPNLSRKKNCQSRPDASQFKKSNEKVISRSNRRLHSYDNPFKTDRRPSKSNVNRVPARKLTDSGGRSQSIRTDGKSQLKERKMSVLSKSTSRSQKSLLTVKDSKHRSKSPTTTAKHKKKLSDKRVIMHSDKHSDGRTDNISVKGKVNIHHNVNSTSSKDHPQGKREGMRFTVDDTALQHRRPSTGVQKKPLVSKLATTRKKECSCEVGLSARCASSATRKAESSTRNMRTCQQNAQIVPLAQAMASRRRHFWQKSPTARLGRVRNGESSASASKDTTTEAAGENGLRSSCTRSRSRPGRSRFNMTERKPSTRHVIPSKPVVLPGPAPEPSSVRDVYLRHKIKRIPRPAAVPRPARRSHRHVAPARQRHRHRKPVGLKAGADRPPTMRNSTSTSIPTPTPTPTPTQTPNRTRVRRTRVEPSDTH